MTCAVVLRHSRGIVLGVDTAMSDEDDMLVHGSKLYRRGQVWMACAGSSNAIERLVDRVPPSAGPKHLSTWLQRRINGHVDGLAVCERTAEIVEFSGGGTCDVLTYTAIGSGKWPAVGAMHALRLVMQASPVAAVLGALRAAAAHTTTVAGPFDLVCLAPGRMPRHTRHR